MENKKERSQSELTKYEWDMLQEYFEMYSTKNLQHFYSYRVGGVSDPGGIQEEWIRKLIRHNTKLKIDCVEIVSEKEVKIIEVKQVADPGALGQLLSYQHLYEIEQGVRPKILLLCLYANDTIMELCDYFGIEVVQIK